MPNATPTSTVQDVGVVSKAQPTRSADSLNSPVRQDQFGASAPWHVVPTRHQLAEEGSYILATNPTISTGLTWVAAQTAFSNTAPNFYIQNPSTTLSLYLDYLKLISTAAATTATSVQYAIHVDTVGRLFTTDNTLSIVPVNPNCGSALLVTPVIKAQNSATVSAFTAGPSATNRLVGRGMLGGLNIIGTELLLSFGTVSSDCYVGAADGAANPGRRSSGSPPVIIPPGGSCTIYIWLPGSAASPAPEFELGMWAR